MIWYGMVWYGMIWYDMVWYGVVHMVWCGAVSARHQFLLRPPAIIPFLTLPNAITPWCRIPFRVTPCNTVPSSSGTPHIETELSKWDWQLSDKTIHAHKDISISQHWRQCPNNCREALRGRKEGRVQLITITWVTLLHLLGGTCPIHCIQSYLVVRVLYNLWL